MKLKFPNIKGFCKHHGSEIMLACAGFASIAAVVTAVHATPKAVILIERRKEALDVDKLTAIETVKTAWTCYIPTAVTETFCLAFIICAATNNNKHNVALSTAYALSETAFKEYRDKVIETIGEKKEKSIRDEIAKDKVRENPPNIIDTPKAVGDQYCYDAISDRYFYSTVQKIKNAQNELNDQMIRSGVGGFAYLNDFYELIGLNGTVFGTDAGWDYYKSGLIDIDFDVILTEDDIPCLVIDYSNNKPVYL